MLKEAIEEKRGETKSEKKQVVEIDVDIDAYIPDTYIKDGYQKIEMYKRFRGIQDIEEVSELKEEMRDRFGAFPDEVSFLFQIAEIKVFAALAGIESIKQSKQDIAILLNEKASSQIEGQEIVNVSYPFGRMASFGMDGKKFKITLHIKGIETVKWLNASFDIAKGLDVARNGKKRVK
jgi:transcription-repair coupling factor (superfamily II helicase)